MNIPLPRNPPKTERVDLNFDFEGELYKMHATIPLREVIKVPFVKETFDNFFKGSDGPMDPPIMLQDNHFRVQYDEHCNVPHLLMKRVGETHWSRFPH
jgi:hypothetical protein